jgi:hypothetical protein
MCSGRVGSSCSTIGMIIVVKFMHCSQIRVILIFNQIRPLYSATVIVVKSIHCIQIHSLYSNPVIVHKHIHYAQTRTL